MDINLSTDDIIFDFKNIVKLSNNDKLTKPDKTIPITYDCKSVLNTLDYIFHNIKVGIYQEVKNGKFIHNYQRINNLNYKNEWHQFIKLKDKYKSIKDFDKQRADEFSSRTRKIFKNMEDWFAINCIIFYEDNFLRKQVGGYLITKKMFESLVKKKKIKNAKFCVNQLDHPILKKKYTQPFEHLFGSTNHHLTKNYHSSYIPIFSYSTSDDYMDIAMPTSECINSIKLNVKITPWESRINTAIFRGSSTGCGSTIKTNLRLKACSYSHKWSKNKKTNNLLDAGITRIINRAKKYKDNPITFVKPKKYKYLIKPFMDMNTQANYKYYLNIEGNGTAYRLAVLLKYGFVILDVETQFHLWFYPLLKPYVNYIPVQRNLKDLKKKIKFCQDNDDLCKKISENNIKFYKEIINKKFMFNYLNNMINKYC